ncbi:MAG: hypothetical protein II059_02785 [Clostridia bacterium]|nr:hypothetical protein [Clostridia bacterium]
MKKMILACVFIASATGMSEATEPLRKYYRTYYGDNKADAAMLCGMLAAKIL